MKLHLPIALRKSLVAVMGSVAIALSINTATAGTSHADVSQITYTDFGQNMGRYQAGNTNALLEYIRERDGGVTIEYLGGQPTFTMPHEMISFESAMDGGAGAGIGYNFGVTCGHNGVLNPIYSSRYIGTDNAIKYAGIEVNRSASVFRLHTGNDHKLERSNKLVTDVTLAEVYSIDSTTSITGQYIYRVGGGYQKQADYEGNITSYAGAYAYITGGMVANTRISEVLHPIDYKGDQIELYKIFVRGMATWGPDTVNETYPLPYSSQGGDSGSPLYIWDESTQSYKFLASHYARGGNWNLYAYTSTNWAQDVMDSFNQEVDMAQAVDNTVYINAVNKAGETITETNTGIAAASTVIHRGSVTTGTGDAATTITEFIGVRDGQNTWKSLSDQKNMQNWYGYANSYMNTAQVTYADLFFTENLMFSTTSAETQNVVLNANIDLGVGYVHFTKGEEAEHATYSVSAADTAYQLNSAGYVVDGGVDVYLDLVNSDASFMREWRKIGDGNLHLVGTGNNEIFLNVGGNGATYLNQKNGYAAYNVLANNGATVVINDVNQIARDLTFGNKGGVLDMNGNSMDWRHTYNVDTTLQGDALNAAWATAVAADGFTINALTEDAIIANNNGSATLTFRETGEQTFLGSFRDTENSSLRIVYDAGADSTWTLNSVYTNLVNENSGLTVVGGRVVLKGINTIHAMGSVGAGTGRHLNMDDWHYADAKMNVDVASSATFELGSHARLIGNVNVADGGSFVMCEGVKHEFEYIEGGLNKESTYGGVADYYGLKGNVHLEGAASTMVVSYSDGTTANTTYSGNITGNGMMDVTLGHTGGTLTLTGYNTFTGAKTLNSGGLIAVGNLALGNVETNKWVIGSEAWLACNEFTGNNALYYIDGSSSGVLALSNDVTEQIDLSNHHQLIIGAQEGKVVQYGSLTTLDEEGNEVRSDVLLDAHNGKWVLGGGGGELVVNFKLSGDNDLVLGNEHGKGIVTLANNHNDFTGDIQFTGGVTLNFASLEMLGGGQVDVSYSSRIFALEGVSSKVTTTSTGVLLVDRATDVELNMTEHAGMFIGSDKEATYTGHIALAEGAAYQFGGATGKMTVASTLESGRDVILDGQTFSGGAVVLGENALALNKNLTVRGYDSEQTDQLDGDITLSFSADNVVGNLKSTTVRDGGIIDLNGTVQTMHNIHLEAGGAIIDTYGRGTLSFDGTSALNGTMNIYTIEKLGSGNLSLGGTNTYTAFNVNAGKITLSSDTSTGREGLMTFASGTKLDMADHTGAGTIVLHDNTAISNMATINGNLNVQDGVAMVSSGSKAGNLQGALAVAENAAINFNMTGKSLYVGSLTGAGNVNVNTTATGTASVRFGGVNNEEETAFTGNISVEGVNKDSGTRFDTFASFGMGTVKINNASFWMNSVNTEDTAVQAMIVVGDNNAWMNGSSSQHYYYTGLAGNGTLRTMISNGSVNFQGDVTGFGGAFGSINEKNYTFGFGLSTGQDYHAVTGNSSADPIELFAASGTTTLGHGSGAGVLTYKFGYSDDVILNATVTGNAAVVQNGTGRLILSKDNTSTTSTLTINEGGRVQLGTGGTTGSWEGSLFGSGMLIVANTSEAGITLTNTVGFTGSIELLTGTSLTFGANADQTFTLRQGESLALAGIDALGSATLHAGSLVLDGGALSFSADLLGMMENEWGLDMNGTTLSTGANFTNQSVIFTNTAVLTTGTFKLATGDWSFLNDRISADEMEYLTATFNATADGLLVTLSAKEGSMVWNGTEGAHTWTADLFGQQTQLSAQAVFNDSAESKNVSIMGSSSVDGILMDAAGDYTFSAGAENAVVTVGEMTLEGTGTTTIESGLQVTGKTTIEDGKLIIKDTATLQGAITGAATLGLDMGEGSGYIANSQLQDLNCLHVMSGDYTVNEAIAGVTTVRVTDGARLSIADGVSQGLNLEIAGSGLASAEADATLMMGAGSAISGTVTLMNDSTLHNDGTVTVTGAVHTGDYTLTKTGAGMLVLNSTEVYGSLDIQGGTLVMGNSKNLVELSSINLGESTTLMFEYGAGMNGGYITMNEGSSIQMKNGGGANTMLNATITLNGNATLGGSVYGNATRVEGVITGNGQLTVNKAGGSNIWSLSSAIVETEGSQISLRYENANVSVKGSNTYTGGTLINGGTVEAGNAYAFGTGAVTMSNAATLKLNAELGVESLSGTGTVNTNTKMLVLNVADADGSAAFNGTINGAGYVVKQGAGSQTLSGTMAVNELTVTEGNLTFSNLTYTGKTDVLEGAMLTLTDKVTLSETVNNAGQVIIGDGTVFALSPTTNQYNAQNNTYTIISGGQISYGAVGPVFTIDGIESADLSDSNFRLTMSENLLTVWYNAEGLRDKVTWNVAGDSGVWNTAKGENHWVTTGGTDSTDFSLLDHVSFGAGTANNVTVQNKVSVASMTVTGENYTFTGGDIKSVGDVLIAAGASASFDQTLTVKGNLEANGALTLNDATVEGKLTSAQNLTVNGDAEFATADITGKLTVGEDAQVSAVMSADNFTQGITVGDNASLTLTGLKGNNIAGVTLGKNATLSLTGNNNKGYNGLITMGEGSILSVNTGGGRNIIANGITLNGDATIDYTKGGDLLVNGNNCALTGNGHTITKTGAGLLWVAPSSMTNVSFVVEEGKLRLGGSSGTTIPTGASSVTLKSGTELSFCADTTSNFATSLSLEGGSAIDLCSTNSGEETYTFIGTIKLTAGIDNAYASILNKAARVLNLDGLISGEGGLKVTGNFTSKMELNLNNAANDFTGGIILDRTNVTLNLKDGASAGTGDILLGHHNTSLVYNGESASTLRNAVSGSGSMSVNSGNLTLTAENTYTGTTTVKNGAYLSLKGAGSIQAGNAVTVAARQTPETTLPYAIAEPAEVTGSLTNVTVTDAALNATDDSVGLLYNTQVTVHSDQYAIKDVMMYSTVINTSVEGGNIALSNVNMSSDSIVMGNNLTTLSMQGVVYTVDGNLQSTLVDGAIFGAAGQQVQMFTLDSFNFLNMEGELILDMTALYANNDWMSDTAYALNFGTDVTLDQDLKVTINNGIGEDRELSFNGSAMLVGVVPEPCTASLSLLGLAAMLLRRRRAA